MKFIQPGGVHLRPAEREEVGVNDSREPDLNFASECRAFVLALACLLSLMSAVLFTPARATTILSGSPTQFADVSIVLATGAAHSAPHFSPAPDPFAPRLLSEQPSVPEVDEEASALDGFGDPLPKDFADFRKLLALPGITPRPPLALYPLRC
jgi:hypothetical protein